MAGCLTFSLSPSRAQGEIYFQGYQLINAITAGRQVLERLSRRLVFIVGRLFGTTGYCSACSQSIPAFEMVMRAKANVYHLECFACHQCNHRFCVGDHFYLLENKILCQYDYEERNNLNSMSNSNNNSSINMSTNSVVQMKKHSMNNHHLISTKSSLSYSPLNNKLPLSCSNRTASE
ncbi:Rhombotin-1 [Nymphon striatum]|nr:Rhombotin-1 [Nymphon striatum]